MTPWSVSPRAGCPKAAARSARFSMLHAPSRSEYSEWTCRWTASGGDIGLASIGVAADGTGVRRRSLRRFREPRASLRRGQPDLVRDEAPVRVELVVTQARGDEVEAQFVHHREPGGAVD